jgi:hypothetical protein
MAQRDIKKARAIVSDDSDSSDSTVTANALPGPRYCKCLVSSRLISNSHDLNLLVYYRLFTENIGILSDKPASPSDPYLGRARANSVAPPQTVYLIKRHLCKIENISDFLGSILFLSGSSLSPLNDTERVSILTPGGPGSSPDEPMELVVKFSFIVRDSEWERISRQAMSPKPRYSARSALVIK